MSTILKHRRGTTAQHASFTGDVGEITVDTDKDTAVVHDGTTVGGFPLLPKTMSDGTANGVAYLNGSKVLTTGSALTFNGTTSLSVGGAGGGYLFSNYDNQIIAGGDSAGYYFAYGNGSGTAVPANYGANVTAHIFRVSNAEQMRLTSTGLGIGTSSPGAKLDVTGTAAISGAVTLSGGTANGVSYLNASKVLTTGSALTFDSSDRLIVGAGSAAVGNRIETTVTGAGGAIAIRGRASDALGYLSWHANAAATEYARITSDNTSSLYFGLGASGSEQMRLTSTGLGIGTSSPVAGSKLTLQESASNPTALALLNRNSTQTWKVAVDATAVDDKILAFIDNATSQVRMALTDTGNLGLGVTPSASTLTTFEMPRGVTLNANTGIASMILGANATFNAGWVYKTSTQATFYRQQSGAHEWHTAPSGTAGNAISFSQVMTLDASGNLALGSTSAEGYKLNVSVGGSSTTRLANDALRLASNGSGADVNINFTDNVANNAFIGMVGGNLYFDTGTAERARITSGGYFKATADGTYQSSTSGLYEFNWSDGTRFQVRHNSGTAANAYGIETRYASTPNGTGNEFLYCTDTDGVTIRATIRSNGGIANYSANDVNLSDRREKTNFAPAKSYLETICSIPVQTFNYIDQNNEADPGLTLGVVAQDVQAVAPELVMESDWGTKDDPKMRLSIYQTDLQYALMKCIQEQQAIINSLKARLDAANL